VRAQDTEQRGSPREASVASAAVRTLALFGRPGPDVLYFFFRRSAAHVFFIKRKKSVYSPWPFTGELPDAAVDGGPKKDEAPLNGGMRWTICCLNLPTYEFVFLMKPEVLEPLQEFIYKKRTVPGTRKQIKKRKKENKHKQ
jgi:hypothetical protein